MFEVDALDTQEEYTVSQLATKIKKTLSDFVPKFKVRGEISNFVIRSSGHVYFNIKDESSYINVVCFSGIFKSLKIDLSDGMDVIILGEITTYGSSYQVKALSISYAGVGALMKIIEERKKKLQNAGLFDQSSKKDIPVSYAISKVGVVTSKHGAVIQDIINRVSARYPKHLMIYDARVQGSGAVSEIIAGIDYFNKIKNPPDVIIIARGGGSAEDLFCFNDESLAFAVFRSHIPIISAIGHETDYSIIDFVADLRASTPTAAAEIITTPTIEDLAKDIFAYRQRISGHILNQVNEASANLATFFDRIKRSGWKINALLELLNGSMMRMKMSMKSCFFNKVNQFNFLQNRIARSSNIISNNLNNKLSSVVDIESALFKKMIILYERWKNALMNKKEKLSKRKYGARDYFFEQDKILEKMKTRIDSFASDYLNKNTQPVLRLKEKLTFSIKSVLQNTTFEQETQLLKLQKFSIDENIKKGYSILTDVNGKIIRTKSSAESTKFIKAIIKDGDIVIKNEK